MMSAFFRSALVCAGLAGVFSTTVSFGQTLGLLQVASGLTRPEYVTAPPGDPRLFILTRDGLIKVRQPDGTLSTFLDISSKTTFNPADGGDERGASSMAFDPNYATNGIFYVYHTGLVTGTGPSAVAAPAIVEQYKVSADPNVANPASAQTVISVPEPNGTGGGAGTQNHKAGWIAFRPGDGNNLYIALGDGGTINNDPNGNGQNTNTLLAKILRITPNASGGGYTVPADNPFVSVANTKAEIWAFGLRNPFRNSFDRSTGAFYIGDVGQSNEEEVDYEASTSVKGQNYGWRAREGTIANPARSGDPTPSNAVNPIFEYAHGSSVFAPTSSAAEIGGYVYRGSNLPSLTGKYLFADYISGKVGDFTYDGTTNFDGANFTGLTDITSQLDPTGTLLGANKIVSFGEDSNGELYIVDQKDGSVFEIVPEPASIGLIFGAAMLGWRRRRSV
jgi:glucose/arabinose dehydrogenase